MEMNNSVSQDTRGRWGRKVKQREEQGQKCGGSEQWKLPARDSYRSFRSQIALSAKSCPGAHRPRLQVCTTHGPGPRKSKSKNKNHASGINHLRESRVWDCVNGLLRPGNSDKLSTHRGRTVACSWQLAVCITHE